MCQPLWWDGSEQMPELLRPAGDQMFDTRAWRGPAVVGGDGIEPPTSTELTDTVDEVGPQIAIAMIARLN